MKNNINLEGVEGKLKTISILMVVMICLMTVSTIVQIVSLGDAKKATDNNVASEGDYDVSEFTEVTADEYVNLFKKNELVVTYTGRAGCGYCVAFIPTLQKAQKEYNFTLYYIDIDKLTQETATKILNLDKEINETLGQTPYVIVSKNGKRVDSLLGAADYEDFAKFLEKNGVKKR